MARSVCLNWGSLRCQENTDTSGDMREEWLNSRELSLISRVNGRRNFSGNSEARVLRAFVGWVAFLAQHETGSIEQACGHISSAGLRMVLKPLSQLCH